MPTDPLLPSTARRALRQACVLAALAIASFAAAQEAAAQMTPGGQFSILDERDFKINTHPDMPFAKKPASDKYQNRVTKDRRRADDGDPSGCNLQCPDSK